MNSRTNDRTLEEGYNSYFENNSRVEFTRFTQIYELTIQQLKKNDQVFRNIIPKYMFTDIFTHSHSLTHCPRKYIQSSAVSQQGKIMANKRSCSCFLFQPLCHIH